MEEIKKALKYDDRFFIDDRNIERLCENTVYKYEVIEIPLGKILREHEVTGAFMGLNETNVYRYLSGTPKGVAAYKEFVDYCNVPFRSFECYDRLIDEVEKTGGYNIKKGAIVVDQDFFIMDGMHRSCFLLKKFGPKYKVGVVKLYYSKNRRAPLRKLRIVKVRIRLWFKSVLKNNVE